MSVQTTRHQSALVESSTAMLMQNIALLALGAIILLAVGFMPMEAAHNAAHDTRHSLAFPCH